MQQALREINKLVFIFAHDNDELIVVSPERTLYECIIRCLNGSNGYKSFMRIDELHSITKSSFLQHDNYECKQHVKMNMNNIKQIIRSLFGIDGMDINFPWRIRQSNNFEDFVQSMPGLMINSDKISIDKRINIQPFLNEIEMLPLQENIAYLISNAIRKDTRYKYMKRSVNIYKKSIEICKLLQGIHFEMNSWQKHDTIWKRLFIENVKSSHSIKMDSILKYIESQNNHRFKIISALELLLYFESNGHKIHNIDTLNDFKLSFYQNRKNLAKFEEYTSLNNINWANIPEIIQPKFLLNQSNKSTKSREKSIRWKQHQIETFYEILKCYFLLKSGKSSLTIVDFGSGAGNVCLCLSYLLPMHTFICVECEKSRVELAKYRAKQCGITNIKFICSLIENIDNKLLSCFDIGIAIHACGIATDYAQIQCIKYNASFILCSCCNGKCNNNLSLSYPRSNYFKQIISFQTFKTLASFSDFNFDEKFIKNDDNNDHYYRYNIKRKFCKFLCEIDRCIFALEKGYNKTILSQIYPNNFLFESSPKSDIIIGILT